MALPQDYLFNTTDPGYSVVSGSPFNTTTSAFNDGVGGLAWGIWTDNADAFTWDITPKADGWFSVLIDRSSNYSISGTPSPIIFRGATQDLLRLRVLTSLQTDWALEYFDGSVWQQVGAAITAPRFSQNVAWKLDVHWNIANSGGEFAIHINDDPVALRSFSGDTLLTADTQIEQIEFTSGSTGTNSPANIYGCLISDTVSTLDLWVAYDNTLNAGNLQEQASGTESSIDEAWQTRTTGDALLMNLDGQRSTFNMGSIDFDLTGLTIDGVVVGLYARSQGAAPLYVNAIIRESNGTVTESDDIAVQFDNISAEGLYFEFANDPATGSAWATDTAIESHQYGVIVKDTP